MVSTLDFSANDVVANAATIPLGTDGSVCAFSNVSADLVIDVSGYYLGSATGRYTPVTPTRLMDSRQGVLAQVVRSGTIRVGDPINPRS